MLRSLGWVTVFSGAMLATVASGLPLFAQAPAPGATNPAAAKPAPGRVSVFNVAKVMKDYKRWQHFAKVMNDKRTAASADLVKLRNTIAELQNKMQAESIKAKQEEIARNITEVQRQFEDKEKAYRKALDEESAGYLRNLFAEIQQCVKAIVEAIGYDIVFAYPDAITADELSSPMYYDLKLRPPAAQPFYVSPNVDMTEVLIATLNQNFPPPAGTPAAATPAPGATPPATPAPR